MGSCTVYGTCCACNLPFFPLIAPRLIPIGGLNKRVFSLAASRPSMQFQVAATASWALGAKGFAAVGLCQEDDDVSQFSMPTRGPSGCLVPAPFNVSVGFSGFCI